MWPTNICIKKMPFQFSGTTDVVNVFPPFDIRIQKDDWKYIIVIYIEYHVFWQYIFAKILH